jgi:hypothetical protein
VGIPLPTVPGSSSLPRLARSRRWLATLTLLASLAAGCGGGQAVASRTAAPPKTSSTAHATGTTPSSNASATPTSYCDAQDTTIPGAAAYLTGGPQPSNLTAVQQAWLQMQSSMVPACSEIVPDPPAVQTKNLTNGELSDAGLQTWVTEDEEFWSLMEWGQQHGQAAFMQYLLAGGSNNAVPFVQAGGKIVDTPACEYLENVDAVSVTGEQMSDLTGTRESNPGVAYVGSSVGPCSSTWTAASGSVSVNPVASGDAVWEVDITNVESGAALGQYLIYEASWVQGGDATADALIQQVQSTG